MANTSALAFAAALLFSATVASATRMPHVDACEEAFRRCDWTFKGVKRVPTFSISGKPDVPITPLIVAKNPKITLGVLNTNHIVPEFIFRSGRFAPITNFGHPNLTPTHFKPFSIPHTIGSGVGFQTFDGNQKKVASGKCVRIFFSHYQRFTGGHPHPILENITVDRSANKCVVFRTSH